MGRHVAVPLSKAGSAQKGRGRTGLSAMEGPHDPPTVQPWARQRAQGPRGQKAGVRLACCIEGISVPYGCPARELGSDQTGASDGTVGIIIPFHRQNMRPKVRLALEWVWCPTVQLHSCPKEALLAALG